MAMCVRIETPPCSKGGRFIDDDLAHLRSHRNLQLDIERDFSLAIRGLGSAVETLKKHVLQGDIG